MLGELGELEDELGMLGAEDDEEELDVL